eukprot:15354894-Ditylum_brightwellii.AAC.1
MHGFASIPQHVRTRLTSLSAAAGTDLRYIDYCYDKLTNLSVNHNDTCIVLNHGLTVGEDKTGGLGAKAGIDSPLLESIDSKQMVKDLCPSQKYHEMDYFLTFTCNQKDHFGTKPLQEWLDKEGWKEHFSGYYFLNNYEQKEIKEAANQASSTLYLCIWQE